MRTDLDTEDEQSVAEKYLTVYNNRSKIPPNSLVVGRYSVLPFYKELEEDLQNNGSELINSYAQHCWIADIQQWYYDFEDITPKTYFKAEDIVNNGQSFVVKGATNSKKFEWDTHMFAQTRADVGKVISNLQKDSLIGSQPIYIRDYVELKKLTESFNGLPIANEFRVFYLDGKVLTSAFYWASHTEDIDQTLLVQPPYEFLEKIGPRIKARFCVVDVALTANGDWIVIELNDAQMSGLSDNSPDELYLKIKENTQLLKE